MLKKVLIVVVLSAMSQSRLQVFSQAPSVPSVLSNDGEMKAAGSWLETGDPKRNRPEPDSKPQVIKSQPLQRSRILLVPATTRAEAIDLLKDDSAILLTDEQVSHLLGKRAPTGDEIVDATIANAGSETNDIFALPAADSIKYAKTLYGKLKPYLVRAVAANAGGRTIFVSWQGEDLEIVNGSLGNFHYIREPLIIYLEAKPERVWIQVHSAM